jgi:hypothetical protein
MSTNDPNARCAQILARLTDATDHARFVGPPIDIDGLDPRQIGDLWPAVHRAHRFDGGASAAAREAAVAIRRQLAQRRMLPKFSDAVLRELVALPGAPIEAYVCQLAEEPSAQLRATLTDIVGQRLARLGDVFDADARYNLLLLARIAGPACVDGLRRAVRERYAHAPYVLDEFDALEHVAPCTLARLRTAIEVHYWIESASEYFGRPLAHEPAYVEFSRRALAKALAQLEDIHAGRVPYQSDKAFTTDDTPVLARAAEVAALRDEAWYAQVCPRLLRLACLAPTAAKTVPSQSLAIRLGETIAGTPTPESVRALRDTLKEIRHAGVEKKLERHLRPAEKNLGARPEVALRLTVAEPDKAQQALLAKFLESTYWQGLALTPDEWRTRLAHAPGGAALARTLVWQAQSGEAAPRSFMLDGEALHDAAGGALELAAGDRIRLWHPVTASDDESAAWQAHIVAARLRQPFRQAFREHYRPADDERAANRTATFAGHTVATRPLLGVARRESWTIAGNDRLIERWFGDVRVDLEMEYGLYPGIDTHCDTIDLHFTRYRDGRAQRTALADLDAVVFSEACRAVDLLVSVSAFAIDDESPSSSARPSHPRTERRARVDRLGTLPLGEMAQMRRRALTLALAHEIDAGRVAVDERHVRVGSHAVHLSTARVTDDGAPVELELPAKRGKLAAVPWLPYDEVLLQRIADAVGALLARR